MKKNLQNFQLRIIVVIAFILTGLTAGAQCLTITCPPSMTTNVAPGLCNGTASYALPTYTNACVPSTTLTYSYTGAVQLFTVPAGVTTMTVILKGAQGANQTPGGAGGLGGMIQGEISVTPGQVLNLYVGGQNGYNGGGTGGINGNSVGAGPTNGNAGNGGGASDIRLGGVALTDRIVVAGGGGGAAHDAVWPSCQPTSAVGNGGNGGGLSGTNGSAGSSTTCVCGGGGGGGGIGGTASAGGAAGVYAGSTSCLRGSWTAGTAGILGIGGNGATTYYNGSGGGGAGGGGYYGGGAGANGSDTTPGGGGGGGSSFAGSATNVVNTAGSNSGNGSIQIILPPVSLTRIGGLASGSSFTLGTTVQTYSVTDYINSNTCSFSVTVIDNIIPTITCPANVSQCLSSLPTTISPLSFTDNCASPAVTYTLTGATTGNGSTNASGVFNTGVTNVIYKATDASGNAGTCSFSVTVYPIPVVSVNNPTICSGNPTVIIPSGASTYTITGGTFNVSPTTNTSYSVIGTSSNGCLSSNTAVANVVVHTTPTLSVNNPTICSGNQAVITPSGANTYTVSGGSFTVTPVANTSYSVTGTSVEGCISSNTAVANIVVHATPTLSVNSATICPGGSVALVATGANTYVITGGNFTVNPTVTTDYSVTGISIYGCIASNTAIAHVFVNPAPIVSVNGGAICTGGSFVITPSGANTYTISGGSFTVNPTTATDYSITGTDANGCVTTTETVLSVTVNPLPTVTANASPIICTGETAVLTASGANTYAWNNGLPGASLTIAPTVNTTYTVTGTDVNGCKNSAVVTQQVDACTGINRIANNIGFSLYPNPSNGEFTVSIEQSTTLTILNHLGQVIYTAELNPGKSTVDLTKYASGVYFVNLQQHNNMKSVKVIKQ